jgi:formylmethanofuran dehydrogenase subunit E
MSTKQNDIIAETNHELDIRYRAHCAKCGHKLSDWALQLPEDKRFCYDCKKPSFERFKKVWK